MILSFYGFGCKTLSHNPSIVLHPDQYVIISNYNSDMIELLIPKEDGEMTYYGWVDVSDYIGWTLIKKTY